MQTHPMHFGAMPFSDLKFAEDLPPHCPNGTASRELRKGFWRFVMVSYPDGLLSLDSKAFSSQHGRMQPCPPNKSPCDWASCSMFSEKQAKKWALISPFKNKPAVCLDVKPEAGPTRLDEDGHLHLWRVENYNLANDVIHKVDKL